MKQARSKSKTKWLDVELMQTDFPPLDWIVPGLMPEGYTILGGRPKAGKSVLSTQVAEAVASGSTLLGMQCEQGKVLYIGVEDHARRLKRRLVDHGYTATGNLEFYTEWEYLDLGGFNRLEDYLAKTKHRLVVLDTLYRLKSPQRGMNDEAAMAELGTRIQGLYREELVAGVLVLHHSNKLSATNPRTYDPITSISGSTAITGSADCVWSIVRHKEKKELRLDVAPREADESTLNLRWDGNSKTWQLKDEIAENTVRGEILRAMPDGVPVSTTWLAVATGKAPPNVSRELTALQKFGLVVQVGKSGKEVLYQRLENI